VCVSTSSTGNGAVNSISVMCIQLVVCFCSYSCVVVVMSISNSRCVFGCIICIAGYRCVAKLSSSACVADCNSLCCLLAFVPVQPVIGGNLAMLGMTDRMVGRDLEWLGEEEYAEPNEKD